jgi:hypothetical protein
VFLPRLPNYCDLPFIEVEISEPQICDLTCAECEACQEEEHGAIPQSRLGGRVHRADDALDCFRFQVARQS